MAIPPPTDWRSFVDGTTGLAAGQPIPWQYGSNDAVAVDLSARMDVDEFLTDVTATLRMIPNIVETDYTDANDGIVDIATSGGIVLVQMADLDAGRYYKLDVLFGPVGNRRGGNTIVQVSM